MNQDGNILNASRSFFGGVSILGSSLYVRSGGLFFILIILFVTGSVRSGSNQQTTNKMWRQELWNNFCPCLVVYTPKRNPQVEWVSPPYQPLTQSQIEDEDFREGPDFIYVCSGGGGSGGEQ